VKAGDLVADFQGNMGIVLSILECQRWDGDEDPVDETYGVKVFWNDNGSGRGGKIMWSQAKCVVLLDIKKDLN
jgi:hypothetical protein